MNLTNRYQVQVLNKRVKVCSAKSLMNCSPCVWKYADQGAKCRILQQWPTEPEPGHWEKKTNICTSLPHEWLWVVLKNVWIRKGLWQLYHHHFPTVQLFIYYMVMLRCWPWHELLKNLVLLLCCITCCTLSLYSKFQYGVVLHK